MRETDHYDRPSSAGFVAGSHGWHRLEPPSRHQADASTYDGVEAFWRFIEALGRLQRRVNED
jgi:hypothetical protein